LAFTDVATRERAQHSPEELDSAGRTYSDRRRLLLRQVELVERVGCQFVPKPVGRHDVHEYEDKSSLVSPARQTLDEDPAPFVVELAAF
jgi:hypothetical protein